MTTDSGSRRPDAGRIYNYLLGGKDNYAEDRQAASQLLAVVPDAPAAAWANRRFLARATQFLAQDAGIGQFIDIGAGLPAETNVHQVVHELDPQARVAYVDNDPVVVSHARALLWAPGVCAVEGDLRDPAGILNHPDLQAGIDLSTPLAIVLGAVLHHVPEEDSPDKLVEMLMAAVAPGSYLVISHATSENIGADAAGQVRELYAQASAQPEFRSRAEVAGFFHGLELVPPGVSSVAAWHADLPVTPGRMIVAAESGESRDAARPRPGWDERPGGPRSRGQLRVNAR
jgi:hypothetical protein